MEPSFARIESCKSSSQGDSSSNRSSPCSEIACSKEKVEALVKNAGFRGGVADLISTNVTAYATTHQLTTVEYVSLSPYTPMTAYIQFNTNHGITINYANLNDVKIEIFKD